MTNSIGKTGNNKLDTLSASTISQKVEEFLEDILSHETFPKNDRTLQDQIDTYNRSSDLDTTPHKILQSSRAASQKTKKITEIPPEGILIHEPGNYIVALSNASSSTLKWSPTSDVAAAITIVANNVTLDFGGHILDTDIQDSSQHLVGIFVFGASNVCIKNGTLTNVGLYGIQAELVSSLSIEQISISGLEYRNLKIRGAAPAGIRVNMASDVSITGCALQYFYTSADSCSGLMLLKTIGGAVENCTSSDIYNYAGEVDGFGYAMCSGIKTTNCHAKQIQSHFGGNIRTGGHTVLGFLPTLCDSLSFDDCSAKQIIGSCDDCHGMSVFIDTNVTVSHFVADQVTDGVTQFNSGAKATGLEIYGTNIQVSNSTVSNIKAINPQDRLSTGFSVWGANIRLIDCHAYNVSVRNDLANPDIYLGTGTGFGWAPDPRLYHTGATNVVYENCSAKNCQVAFDTWNHIRGQWNNPSYENCAINILVEPGGTRTVYGKPCTECNPAVEISVKNQAKHNTYPGSPPSNTANFRVPYPTANINGLSIPSALSRIEGVDSQWWFYVGLLRDNTGESHSFELTFIEPGNTLGESGLTAVDFDFSFKTADNHFHATSTYGGNMLPEMIQSVMNVVGLGSVKAEDQTYTIDVKGLTGSNIQVTYDAAKSVPTASMFTGKVGQPGAAYTLKGTGSTWLWKYPETGQGEAAPYSYSVDIDLIDERGLVSEGLGSYVGIDPLHPPATPKNSSVEYAQPRLRVTNWTITLTQTPASTDSAQALEGFEPEYSFTNQQDASGQIWLDRQALFQAPQYPTQPKLAAVTNALAEIQKNTPPAQILEGFNASQTSQKQTEFAKRIQQSISTHATNASASKQLYVGCSLPLILTEGTYAGSTLLFAVFWKKAKPIADYDTETDAYPNSFMNLYTGLLGDNAYDLYSAYTQSDCLNPALAAKEPTKSPKPNNFRIQFTQQFQSIGDLPDPQRWASEIEVTVKAYSQARYALSAYAKRADQVEATGIDADLTFTIKALSPYTTTTPVSSDFSPPIYEGASLIYSEKGTEIGTGWIEQMVGAPES